MRSRTPLLIEPLGFIGTGSPFGQLLIATWRAEDVDDDGHLELVLVFRYTYEVVCGRGPLQNARIVIVTLEAAPSIALSQVLSRSSVAGEELRSHVTHEEVNGDGHRDVRIRARGCEDRDAPSRCGAPRILDFVYDPARDRFVDPASPPAPSRPCDED